MHVEQTIYQTPQFLVLHCGEKINFTNFTKDLCWLFPYSTGPALHIDICAIQYTHVQYCDNITMWKVTCLFWGLPPNNLCLASDGQLMTKTKACRGTVWLNLGYQWNVLHVLLGLLQLFLL